MTSLHEDILYYQELAFTSVFLLDILMKLTALGPCIYISKKWNRFDVFIVSAQVAALFTPQASFVKILRTLRVLRLVKTSVKFRMLLSTVISSVGTIMEIVLLMGVLLLSYSFIGMNIFEGSSSPQHFCLASSLSSLTAFLSYFESLFFQYPACVVGAF